MPTVRSKYTSEFLSPIVASSESFAQVLRVVGVKQTGGNQTYIRKVVARLGLTTSHFKGQAINRGKPSATKKHYTEVLIRREPGSERVKTYVLRRAILESGRPHICAKCLNDGVWLGEQLRLHIHHEDGDSSNNLPANVSFLCPNCHSQTPNFGFVGDPVAAESRRKARRRVTVHKARPKKITWPSVEAMTLLVVDTPASLIAKQLGVSDVAVAKFCKKHGIARKSRGDWNRKVA